MLVVLLLSTALTSNTPLMVTWAIAAEETATAAKAPDGLDHYEVS
jgi:hypothetical protein